MKILVIPDVHLNPQMFNQATALQHQGFSDRAVWLMDIPHDWDKQYNVGLYEETYDEAIRFAKAFPETAWCYGNHDLSYLWHCLESGYSSMASMTVQRKLLDLREAVPEDNPIKYVQRIDNVLFSHGGVLNFFVEEYVPRAKYNDVDAVLETINQLGRIEMWNDASPIWLRPQHSKMRLYKPRKLLQVVGHTPMDAITKEGNLISTDVFSTYRGGKPIGTEEFLLLDTVTWEYCGIKMQNPIRNWMHIITDIITMMSGERVKVKTKSYQNDMVTFKNKDDVLTALIHLGYLAYDRREQMAYIPNEEIRSEVTDAVKEHQCSIAATAFYPFRRWKKSHARTARRRWIMKSDLANLWRMCWTPQCCCKKLRAKRKWKRWMHS